MHRCQCRLLVQTNRLFLLKEGKEFKVARQFQHSQARKAEINYEPDRPSLIEENTGNVIL